MSRLSEELKMVKTGVVYSGFNGILKVDSQYSACKPYEYLDEYSVRVVLGCNVQLSMESSGDFVVINEVKKNVAEHIVNVVFEEFKQPLLDLRTSLYKKGLINEADKVSSIMKQMFKV